MEEGTSETILFFGRFHPLILHLPIGFLVMAFILEALSRIKRFGQFKVVIGVVLLLGASSAVLAAALGYMLAQEGGYNDEILLIHQWAGITLAFAAVVAYVLYRVLQTHPSAALDKVYLAVMIMMMVSLTVAGHFGGSLTHGSDYLTQYMPNGLRKIGGLPPKKNRGYQKITNLEEAKIFDQIVYPILDSRCISCHNESKKKGDLMLHTQEDLLKGGEGGAVLVPGDPEQSELLKRIHLPITDDKHMPPDGKTQLTYEQTELLTWWIKEGASFNKSVAEVTVDKEVRAILNTLVNPDANKSDVEILLASEQKPAEGQKLLELRDRGIKVKPLAAKTNWLQAKVPRGNSADFLINTDFTGIAAQITWLDLGGTGTTDEAVAPIVEFENLTRLHLENTLISDQGMQYLGELAYLEYLNLVGTRITDEGIHQLLGLKNLRKLYLWKTEVSKEGIQQLKESLPELEIHTGIEFAEEESTLPG